MGDLYDCPWNKSPLCKELGINVKLKSRVDWAGYIYILPAFIFLGVFIFYGVGYNFFISLTKWDGISAEKEFVGMGNYVKLFTADQKFLNSLTNSLKIAVMVMAAAMVAGFLLALIFMILQRTKGQNFLKGLFFFPHIVAPLVIGLTFRGPVYNQNFGFLNIFLETVGLGFWQQNWLGDLSIVLGSVGFTFIYTEIGFAMVIYITGLLTIPEEIIEAAKIDGAGFWQIVIQIILPQLSATHTMVVIYLMIHTIKQFDLVWIMTEGGPASSTELVSTYIYRQAMLFYNQGTSAAISIIVLIIVLTISAAVISYQLRRTKYA